jgi:hypothetical protein
VDRSVLLHDVEHGIRRYFQTLKPAGGRVQRPPSGKVVIRIRGADCGSQEAEQPQTNGDPTVTRHPNFILAAAA